MHYSQQVYRSTSRRCDLDATLELLGQTSLMLDVFTDLRPIRSVLDHRLQSLRDVLAYIDKWVKYDSVNYQTNFITRECHEDLQSMLVGFQKLVEIKLASCPLGYICPGRTNTDIVENWFCNMRGINGANCNPTYLQYQKGINTILISRKMVSTKSNTKCKFTINGAVPYKVHTGKSFRTLRL